MKKFSVLLALSFCVWMSTATAQNVRLHLYTAYAFDDQFDSYYDQFHYYEGTIKGAFQWGAGVEFMLHPTTGIELLYLRQDTHAPTTYLADGYGTGVQFQDFNLAMNYIMLGGNRHFGKAGSKADPYAGLMAGLAIAEVENPVNGNNASAEKFSWGLKLGCDIWASPKFAIKLQGQMLSVTQAMGGSVYFGTGGTGAGVSSYSTIYQFTLGGGLAFKFGHTDVATQ